MHLAELTPGDIDVFFFTNGGAEANENAFKIARAVTGRLKILARYRSYHGATAAAIAACGLIELAKQTEGRQSSLYLDGAIRMLRALAEHSFDWNGETDCLLTKCTAAYHDAAHEFSIIYGDYYFLEALMKLTGKELFIW